MGLDRFLDQPSSRPVEVTGQTIEGEVKEKSKS